MKKRECCFIDPISHEPCGEMAEWMIVDGPTVDDFTDACTAHVGPMLQPVNESRVYQIVSETVAGL